MSTPPTHYGSIPSSNHHGDHHRQRSSIGSRHGLKEIIEDEFHIITEEVKTVAHSPLKLSEHAVLDANRLHRDPAAGTATIPSEVANMGEPFITLGTLYLSRLHHSD